MAKFFVSKNPELRVRADSPLVEWLKGLPDSYHAFLAVIGTDFKSDCILIKSQGILNVYVDPANYTIATKEGPWSLRGSSQIANPISALEDSTDKIRDFLISVGEKIFPELKTDHALARQFAKKLKVLWVVALTHPYPKGTHPTTSGRIFYNPGGVTHLAKSWLSPMPWGLGFGNAAVSQLANILGLEAISESQLSSLRISQKPLTRNPYHFTGEVLAAKFRGRSKEIAVAKTCLSQNPSTPVALVGLQRTGKSSLGAEVLRQLMKDDRNIRIISYVLGEFDPNGECADIAGFLLKSIPDKDALGKLLDSVPKLKKTVGLERELFRDALKILKRKTGRPTVLFLDELHKLDERSAGAGHSTFPDFLENIVKDKSLGLRVMLSARPILMTDNENLKRVNLLKLFRPITVASVDKEAAIEIINFGRPNLRFEPAAVERILTLSGRNPYWIQLLCFEAFLDFQGRASSGNVTLSIINSIFLELLKSGASRSYFEAQYLDVIPLGPPMTILDKVARLANLEGAKISCTKLLPLTNNSAENLNRDLRPLLDYEILAKDGQADPVTVSFISEGLRLYLRYERNLALGPL